MNLTISPLFLAIILFFGLTLPVFAGDKEYSGQFETVLAPNVEDFEQVVFKSVSADKIKNETALSPAAHLAAARLYNPQTGTVSVAAVLVEDKNETPQIFVDLSGDGQFGEDEKFTLKQQEEGNPYLWIATVNLPVKDNFFTACPIFLRYFKTYKTEKMTSNDRLVTQSTDVLARGKVEAGGKRILVQYAYSFEDKTINPQVGWLGVDGNEDGEIDMDSLSPEAAKAARETIVFRVGQSYFSTKKVDVKKNLIILREHEAKDYKRLELAIGKQFPDFDFTDFAGKQRKFSEFRGKFVLLDVWGLWCPPCRKELPFLLEASRRFQARNLELVGLNTDAEMTPARLKSYLDENEMKWPQAQLESTYNLLNIQLRIESFPSTFLISPEGNILSMSRSERGEPDLRGADLLDTLDEILPKTPKSSN
jgi:thiol-disulfide isomerase/thioredoxin